MLSGKNHNVERAFPAVAHFSRFWNVCSTHLMFYHAPVSTPSAMSSTLLCVWWFVEQLAKYYEL
jgi:hypothetical protein